MRGRRGGEGGGEGGGGDGAARLARARVGVWMGAARAAGMVAAAWVAREASDRGEDGGGGGGDEARAAAEADITSRTAEARDLEGAHAT